MSPALAGGFLTAVPPGKPSNLFLKVECVYIMYSLKKDKKAVNQNVSISQLQGWIVHNFNFFVFSCISPFSTRSSIIL